MRAVLQRVSRARVRVGETITGEIGAGLVALIGVERGDTDADVQYLAAKIPNLRLFADDAGKMNLSLKQCGGAILAISQFTLLADCRKGLRPSFERAAAPAEAEALYQALVAALREAGCEVATGVFRAVMSVELANEGPVTICLESRDRPDGEAAKRG
ncbi:MAG TPA: D-aminoacyl-tRNA deacylase [Terriglobales bacterium]|nr:D-aminoacyl-tRNA deacylase [Terriglobales bacterium]